MVQKAFIFPHFIIIYIAQTLQTNTATHIDTLINGKVKRDYVYQMQSLMMCGNRKWCDFISFDPRLPENLQLYIKRVYRDEVMFAEIKMEVEKFKTELQEMLKKLKNL